MSKSLEYIHQVDRAIAERKAADDATDPVSREAHNRRADKHANKAWILSQGGKITKGRDVQSGLAMKDVDDTRSDGARVRSAEAGAEAVRRGRPGGAAK